MRNNRRNNTEKPPLNPHAGQHATQNRDGYQRKEQTCNKAAREDFLPPPAGGGGNQCLGI
jgi:hypothetical protein